MQDSESLYIPIQETKDDIPEILGLLKPQSPPNNNNTESGRDPRTAVGDASVNEGACKQGKRKNMIDQGYQGSMHAHLATQLTGPGKR